MGFLKLSFFLLILSNLANVLNYAAMIFLSRNLSKIDFATISSVTALGPLLLSSFAVVPSIYILILNDGEKSTEERAKISAYFSKWVLAASAIIFIALLLSSKSISIFLQLNSQFPIIIYSCILLLSLFFLVLVGFSHGFHKYRTVQFLTFFLSAVKLSSLVGMFYIIGGSVYVVLIAEAVAMLLSVMLFFYCLKKSIPYRLWILESKYRLSPYMSSSFPIAVSFALTGAMLAGDLVLVKHFFSAEIAGEYSVAANLGKAAYFISGAVSGIIFAVVIRKLNEGISELPVIILSLIVAAGAGGVIVFLSFIFPVEIITTLFGDRYIGSIELFQLSSISMTIFSMNTVLFNYFLARKEYGYLYMSIFFLMLFVVFVFFNNMALASDLAISVLVLMSSILLWNLVFLFYIAKLKRIETDISGS